MNEKIKNSDNDALFSAILTLRSLEDCYNFFEDLCTVSELKAMAQRFAVARMLKDKHTFNEIAEKTGASTATISRVKKCLEYGSDGYEKVLSGMTEWMEN